MALISADQNLFVVDIEYTVPIEKVEPLIEGHMQFIEQNYAENRFLASGPKVPRTGGVIIAVGTDKAEIERELAKDPFSIENVAKYTVTEFIPRSTVPGLK